MKLLRTVERDRFPNKSTPEGVALLSLAKVKKRVVWLLCLGIFILGPAEGFAERGPVSVRITSSYRPVDPLPFKPKVNSEVAPNSLQNALEFYVPAGDDSGLVIGQGYPVYRMVKIPTTTDDPMFIKTLIKVGDVEVTAIMDDVSVVRVVGGPSVTQLPGKLIPGVAVGDILFLDENKAVEEVVKKAQPKKEVIVVPVKKKKRSKKIVKKAKQPRALPKITKISRKNQNKADRILEEAALDGNDRSRSEYLLYLKWDNVAKE